MSTSYKMDDESIVMIAKLLQIALLTGTDIVDNLRTMRFELVGDDTLTTSVEFVKTFEDNLQKMQDEIQITNQA